MTLHAVPSSISTWYQQRSCPVPYTARDYAGDVSFHNTRAKLFQAALVVTTFALLFFGISGFLYLNSVYPDFISLAVPVIGVLIALFNQYVVMALRNKVESHQREIRFCENMIEKLNNIHTEGDVFRNNMGNTNESAKTETFLRRSLAGIKEAADREEEATRKLEHASNAQEKATAQEEKNAAQGHKGRCLAHATLIRFHDQEALKEADYANPMRPRLWFIAHARVLTKEMQKMHNKAEKSFQDEKRLQEKINQTRSPQKEAEFRTQKLKAIDRAYEAHNGELLLKVKIAELFYRACHPMSSQNLRKKMKVHSNLSLKERVAYSDEESDHRRGDYHHSPYLTLKDENRVLLNLDLRAIEDKTPSEIYEEIERALH